MHIKMLSLLFSAFMLLSSGAMQLGVHLCSKSGPSFFSNCESNHQNLPDCCAKKQKQKTHSTCCQDAYLFAITPKFGGIEKVELPFPAILCIGSVQSHSTLLLSDCGNGKVEAPEHSPPKLFNRGIQQHFCLWII
jgi:hypothetical protein